MTARSKHKLAVVAPIYSVADVRKSLKYYTEKLSFSVGFEWADETDEPIRYAVLQNGDCELHLSQSEIARKSVAYFFVHGVQEFYGAIKAQGAIVTQEIEDQPWDMREFEVTDPDGNLLIFGEHLSRIIDAN